MKVTKISILGLSACLMMGASAASQMDRFSVGWMSFGASQGLSFRTNLLTDVIFQGIIGSGSVSFSDPIVSLDGETESFSGSINITTTSFGGRILYVVRKEENMRTYIGGGLSYLSYYGKADIDNVDYSASGSSYQYSLLGGTEFQLQGLPNLSFTTEVGYSRTSLGTVQVVSQGDVGTINPSGSASGFNVGLGMNYFF
jgi:hypothetical protein